MSPGVWTDVTSARSKSESLCRHQSDADRSARAVRCFPARRLPASSAFAQYISRVLPPPFQHFVACDHAGPKTKLLTFVQFRILPPHHDRNFLVHIIHGHVRRHHRAHKCPNFPLIVKKKPCKGLIPLVIVVLFCHEKAGARLANLPRDSRCRADSGKFPDRKSLEARSHHDTSKIRFVRSGIATDASCALSFVHSVASSSADSRRR